LLPTTAGSNQPIGGSFGKIGFFEQIKSVQILADFGSYSKNLTIDNLLFFKNIPIILPDVNRGDSNAGIAFA